MRVGNAKSQRPARTSSRWTQTGPPKGSQVLEVPRASWSSRPAPSPTSRTPIQNSRPRGRPELSGRIKNPRSAPTRTAARRWHAVHGRGRAGVRPCHRSARHSAARRSSCRPAPPRAARGRATALRDHAGQPDRLARHDRLPREPEGSTARPAPITGLDSSTEAQDLAERPRIGALPIELKLVSETTVSASLGQQALDQGLLARRRRPGPDHPVPAGLLSRARRGGGDHAGHLRGVPVALVKLIRSRSPCRYRRHDPDARRGGERQHRHLRANKGGGREPGGRSAAISNGYAKALRTIIDANVVTIGVAFILFTLATAGIKGFAFTLGIGTIVSLFTAGAGHLGHPGRDGALARDRVALRHRRQRGEGRFSHFDFVGRSSSSSRCRA